MEEDLVILTGVAALGRHWSAIAPFLSGRSVGNYMSTHVTSEKFFVSFHLVPYSPERTLRSKTTMSALFCERSAVETVQSVKF